MKLKKSAQNRQNEENATSNGMFKSKKEFKIYFWNLYLFLAYFEQKDFLKNCEFWSKFDITNVFLMKLPF